MFEVTQPRPAASGGHRVYVAYLVNLQRLPTASHVTVWSQTLMVDFFGALQ